jgi:autotransporter adhesin
LKIVRPTMLFLNLKRNDVMNKSYITVWNEKLGAWVAASEIASANGKRSKSRRVLTSALVATAGIAALASAPSAIAGGALQLCGGSAGGVAGGTTGSGYSYGAGSAGANSLTCTTAAQFSLNNAGDDNGSGGLFAATARVTGYSDGLLELMGEGGISMLGQVQMNGNTLTGLGMGAISATSTDAVNGSQLYATNQAIANASRYFKAGGLEDGTDDAVAGANSVAIGAGASANAGKAATASWNNPLVAGTANTETQGVAIGANARASLGGIALGDTAISDEYSGVALGAYTVAGSHGTAVGAGAMAQGTDSAALGFNALATGGSSVAMGNFSTASGLKSSALGAKADAQAANSVALGANSVADRDDSVSVGNATLKRQITNVAAGELSADSTDAVIGSQLYGNASSMAKALGGGSIVNADGTISAPSYSVGGTTVHSVGDAVTNLDDRVVQNTTDITKLQNQVGDVGTQLSGAVQYDRHADGSVNFGSVTLGAGLSAGPVVLTNVANGTSQYDAVNYGQLSALQDQVTGLNGQVTGLNGQMQDLGSQVANIQTVAPDVSSPDSNTDVVANVAAPGAGVSSTAVGANANAASDNAVAVGNNAAATGVNSTAIGTGAQAGNANSVALGQGSVTDRDNSVSVGSAGNQRQITNVAAGTADTDAVNVGQMNSSVAQGVQQANNYTDQRINATTQAINDVAKNAYAGVAAAMAMPNMTPSGPGKTIVAAGGATYKGGSAAAVGATYRSQNSRWLVNAAVSVTSTGDAGVRAQVGYEF